MKFTAAILALAATAVAVPTGGQGGNNVCSSIHGDNSHPHLVCCQKKDLLDLSCLLQLGSCNDGNSYCCNSNVVGNGGLINLNLVLLNCLQL